MGKSLDQEALEVIEAIENHSHLNRPVFSSEAEQMAAESLPPRKRQDGTLVGQGKAARRQVLTDQQLAFAEHIIRGRSQRAAYRLAYPNTAASDQSVSTSASKLLKDPRISKLVEDAAEQSLDYLSDRDNADVAKTWVMKRLMQCATTAKQEGSMLKALELIGRGLGMWQPQIVSAPEAVNAETLKRELDKHLVMLDDVSVKQVKRSTVIDAGQALNEEGKVQPVDPTVPPSPLCDAT